MIHEKKAYTKAWMKGKKRCLRCNHPVGNGNVHKADQCPPKAGIYGEHRRRAATNRRRAKFAARYAIKRGMAVVGTGKLSASSDKSRKKAKDKTATA